MTNSRRDDDDGRVIADMSEVGSRPPMLIPRPDALRGSRRDMTPADEAAREVPEWERQETEVAPEERRALIGGAVSAGLLVVGVIAAAFALMILLISHM